ncbi:MAG: DNA-3-methyladenine glycosylase I [Myxococcales bacterium]|nr:MAG: DNA-3-methyladenine glycosylase I [Myxococcales bacterium]
MPKGVVVGTDEAARCFWAAKDPDYIAYHDREWGLPVRNDQRLFEKICLEGFQAGLSWITILRKREAFRKAFADFAIEKVARFDARRVARLLEDPGIVRHRGKIESAIHNAKRTLEVIDEAGSLASFLWRFEPGPKERPRRMTRAAIVKLTETPSSQALSRELRQRGFRYVGPTTMYALMQSVGIVNDHLEGCDARPRAEAARKVFRSPAG